MDTLVIEGTVYMRDDKEASSNYEQARTTTFPVNAHARKNASPLLIAQVATESDVQACVKYAGKHKLQIAIRSGGHSWVGSSLQQDTLLIDMKRFDSMEIDPVSKTAKVGPCVKGQDLSNALAKHDLCFPSGHCHGVVLGGFLLGGGYGWFSEFFGISSDSILSMTVVTAAGELLEVNDETHPEWMWMARGAASAFPGVVLSFTVRVYKLPPVVRFRPSFHPVADYAAIAEYFRAKRLDKSLPSNVEIGISLCSTPPPLAASIADEKICFLAASFLADSDDEFEKNVAIVNAVPSTPLIPHSDEPVPNVSFAELSAGLIGAYPPGHYWSARSYVVDLADSSVDWVGVKDAFSEKAPLGPSQTLTVIGCKSPGTKGVFGPFPGMVLSTYAVTDDEKASGSPDLTGFQETTAKLVEPKMVRFNPLENPLNKATFVKSFIENGAETLLELREKYDPDGIFWNPSETDAW